MAAAAAAALGDKARGSSNSNSKSSGKKNNNNSRWSSGPPQHMNKNTPKPTPPTQPSNSNSNNNNATSPMGNCSFSSVASGNSNSSKKNIGSRTRSQDKREKSPPDLIDGEDPEQVEVMHNRLLYILSYLVGSQVKVSAKNGQKYTGVLDSINPNDAQSVVLRYAYLQTSSSKTAPPIDKLAIKGEDCLAISGVASFDQEGRGSSDGSMRKEFQTDTDISNVDGQGAQRELHRWVPGVEDGVDPLDGGLEGGEHRSWDQFATNEKLFGLTTDFDEEIYTTKLDRTGADYKEKERAAIRIAKEIQTAPYLNAHVAEERHEMLASNTTGNDEDEMDEEDRYGAVLRPSGAPGKYVPPYMRSKEEPQQQKALPTTGKDIAKKPSSPQPEQKNNVANKPDTAAAAAALAKLNIQMTSQVSTPGSPASSSSNTHATLGGSGRSVGLAADPAIAALSKGGPSVPGNSKLANLRGLKNRTDADALTKPMADITEKLQTERERMRQHKQALVKNRMSELVKFHKSFKLTSPMPEDVAEITGVKKRGSSGSPSSSSTTSEKANPFSPEVKATKKEETALSEVAAAPAAPAEEESLPPQKTTQKSDQQTKKKKDPDASSGPPTTKEVSSTSQETKKKKKKDSNSSNTAQFKFNAKASSFKPSTSASPFVPKGSSGSNTDNFNVFFGRRILKRTSLPLWGGAIKTPLGSQEDKGTDKEGQTAAGSDDDSPIWPFGTRTYRNQMMMDEAEAMMYQQPPGFMPQYDGYGGYYSPYQYPPPHPHHQMPMMPPGMAPHMSTSSPYSTAGYMGGPFSSAPGYPSPIMGISASTGPAAHPLPHMQIQENNGSGSNVDGASSLSHHPHQQQTAMALDMMTPGQQSALHGTAPGSTGSDSPSVMYGMPQPVSMGMPPPSMPFNSMQQQPQPGGFMTPPPQQQQPHQTYPTMPPSGTPHQAAYYQQYPSGQKYGNASPPPPMGMGMIPPPHSDHHQ